MLRKILHKEVILYIVIGFSGLFLDLLIFYLMSDVAEMNYQFSNWVSTSMGITNNFLLNAFFNFKKKDRLWVRYARFYLIGCVGLALTAAILHVGVECLGAPKLWTKCFAIFFVFVVQYTLNKKFSFG